jgi:hypothetical protein
VHKHIVLVKHSFQVKSTLHVTCPPAQVAFHTSTLSSSNLDKGINSVSGFRCVNQLFRYVVCGNQLSKWLSMLQSTFHVRCVRESSPRAASRVRTPSSGQTHFSATLCSGIISTGGFPCANTLFRSHTLFRSNLLSM